ncbi:hypothetical protein e1116g03.tmp0051 [Eimeria tenella]|uniref:Uncharacterized protein n=1 Tax=Eimeria tenella TaxID=5802 RepID=C8TE37_EIMTE|nr:hypothetical protein e1116g03.tmp0051 [Eimeria tenella]
MGGYIHTQHAGRGRLLISKASFPNLKQHGISLETLLLLWNAADLAGKYVLLQKYQCRRCSYYTPSVVHRRDLIIDGKYMVLPESNHRLEQKRFEGLSKEPLGPVISISLSTLGRAFHQSWRCMPFALRGQKYLFGGPKKRLLQ